MPPSCGGGGGRITASLRAERMFPPPWSRGSSSDGRAAPDSPLLGGRWGVGASSSWPLPPLAGLPGTCPRYQLPAPTSSSEPWLLPSDAGTE
jgi:hypothetical protein